MIKIWTYKSKRNARDVGIIVQFNGERIYYKLSSEYLINRRSNRKRRKLKIGWINSTFISFTYFPNDFCKPRHYLEVDQIYIHEILRLLERLR